MYDTKKQLQQHAINIRKNILKMVANAQSGHIGGSLSSADIITYLYFNVMDKVSLMKMN